MRAYYYGNISADQCLPHGPGLPARPYPHHYPFGHRGRWETVVDKLANECGWDNRDTTYVTKEGLGDYFERMHDKFFTELYPTDRWIRVRVLPGVFIIIPAGIYHRFTLDGLNQGEFQYFSRVRGLKTDASPFCYRYLDSLKMVLGDA
ncbi:1,2-dihydroxy-3-keto-5-methylthiopentene dioxygenase [Lactarius vividus]|nr:1,2-dihydroxy-3-keto-5-methylthiopentene dioxygenase [Lactarius vividus]